MDIEELKKTLNNLKEKYSNGNHNVSDYYSDVMETLDNFAEETGNYAFEKAIPCIVTGAELYGEDYCEEVCDVSNNLYIFNGWQNVSSLDHDDVNEMIDKSISFLTKEKDFDIC